MTLELAKRGRTTSTADFRDVMLRRQVNRVYDIYLVRYNFTLQVDPPDAIDNIIIGLSTRRQDQLNEDEVIFAAAPMLEDNNNIFAVATYHQTLTTSGRVEKWNDTNIPYAKPYTVPYCAVVVAASLSQTNAWTAEVYYEQRIVSPENYAIIISRVGDRARTE